MPKAELQTKLRNLTGAAEDDPCIPSVANTFLELAKLATWDGAAPKVKKDATDATTRNGGDTQRDRGREELEGGLRLSYTINLNLPATTEIEVQRDFQESTRESAEAMMGVDDLIKLFGMQNLLLESELKKLEDSGVQIEHSKTIQQAEIVDVDLFESDIVQEARRMADFYAKYYALENSIRRLIAGRLSDKHGLNWWKEKVPAGAQTEVEKKQQDEKGHSHVHPFRRPTLLHELRGTYQHLRGKLG